MNIPAFQAAAQAMTNAVTQPAQSRPQASTAAPTQTLTREAAERPPETRPVLEASEPSLTRRDLPRGSLIDIIA